MLLPWKDRRCIVCLVELEAGLSNAHVIPQSVGGRLVVKNVQYFFWFKCFRFIMMQYFNNTRIFFIAKLHFYSRTYLNRVLKMCRNTPCIILR